MKKQANWPARDAELLNYYNQVDPVLSSTAIARKMKLGGNTIRRRIVEIVPESDRREVQQNISGLKGSNVGDYVRPSGKVDHTERKSGPGGYSIVGPTLPPLPSLLEPVYDSGF